MKLELITEGLLQLLKENNYNPNTIVFYEREWKRLRSFLMREYGDSEFDMERGLLYLEKQYGIIGNYNDGTLSQRKVQLLRVIHILEDYSLHQILTRRYYSHKNPISLKEDFEALCSGYANFMAGSELSATTFCHYKRSATLFLDYLTQKKVPSVSDITMDTCNSYLKTFAGYTSKTVEQQVCGLRHFLRFLYSSGMIGESLADRLHMPAVSKSAKIPSTWQDGELKAMIAAIDRNSPLGKRDYAMILLACILGIRIGDIKKLRFRDFNWEEKSLSFIQHKTHKSITLPLPDAIGWAVIDYIRNGRPAYYDSDIVFLKHMPPFDPISDNDHLAQRIVFYMRKAGIDRRKKKHSGFHSLRHSAGSMLLEMETPLPVISEILGHSDSNITAVYLKTDLKMLAECVLSTEGFRYE